LQSHVAGEVTQITRTIHLACRSAYPSL
jgi:hypothetical protein